MFRDRARNTDGVDHGLGHIPEVGDEIMHDAQHLLGMPAELRRLTFQYQECQRRSKIGGIYTPLRDHTPGFVPPPSPMSENGAQNKGCA